LIDQCAAHLKNTTFLSNIRIVFVPAKCTSHLQSVCLGIICAFKCHYRKHLIQKTVAKTDEELLQGGTQMKLICCL
jgi:hypothetical protein